MSLIKKYKAIFIAPAIFLAVLLLSGCENGVEKAVSTQPAVSVQKSTQSLAEVKGEAIEEQPAISLKEEIALPPEIKETIKEETKTENIAFKTVNQNDSTLEEGKTKIKREGVVGIKEFKYEVYYADEVETGRKLVSETVKVEPISKIVSIGTKEAESIVIKSESCGSDYYRNVDGDCIHRPSSNPSGATAKCKDGSYSYSQHRQGTCSGHSGVAQWL